MAWAMKGQQKSAKEVSEIFVCVCALHQKEAKQPVMGQGPIDEIDFCFFGCREEREGTFQLFFHRQTHWFNEE